MPATQARRIIICGRVQGVGFRPFVYRTAHALGLKGWVLNGSGKVLVHAEGEALQLDRLEQALVNEAPPLARPRLESATAADIRPFDDFEIRASASDEAPEIHVPPDLFTCQACVEELTDPAERRHGYPFINCTQCGPRYTLITAMPYDRPNTSMAGFPLCEHCRSEYESPLDRRFHAQPLACEECGPALTFRHGEITIEGNQAALDAAVRAIDAGRIVAIKGVGGYHLVCDAASEEAVITLRERKCRPHKPLAVMFPFIGADGLDAVRRQTAPNEAETEQLTDPSRPIVLVKKAAEFDLTPSLTGDLAELGVFLPYSPLHYCLLNALGKPVVATSGNLSGEPVITDENEAERRLGEICDAFLHHNRPIVRPADDPVVRVINDHPQLIRPGRGIAPLELTLPCQGPEEPVIALGGHMKNTIALAWKGRIVVSPHVGELDTPRSMRVFSQVIEDLPRLYGVEASRLLCDEHPGYASSRWASRQALPVERVLHHHAHASALAGEHPDIDRWLTFTWDGVGYGENGSLWGGEALAGHPGDWHRVSSFRPLRLLGGDRAAREPWRAAAALMWGAGVDWEPPVAEPGLARMAWNAGAGVLESSAVGRLFDAAAALVLNRHHASFEGQGPMELEALAGPGADAVLLPVRKDDAGLPRCDCSVLIPILTDAALDPSERASIFHASLAGALVDQAVELLESLGFEAVGLSGGVFQNRVLTEYIVSGLSAAGIPVRLHRHVPANDAGICYGQVIEHLGRNGRMSA